MFFPADRRLHVSWYSCFFFSISLMIPLDCECWSPCQRGVFCFVSRRKCSSPLLGPVESQRRLNKRNWHLCLRVTLDSWAFGKLALMEPLEAPSQPARSCWPILGAVCACRPKKLLGEVLRNLLCLFSSIKVKKTNSPHTTTLLMSHINIMTILPAVGPLRKGTGRWEKKNPCNTILQLVIKFLAWVYSPTL